VIADRRASSRALCQPCPAPIAVVRVVETGHGPATGPRITNLTARRGMPARTRRQVSPRDQTASTPPDEGPSMSRRLRAAFATTLAVSALASSARADLFEYLKKPDDSFAWKQVENHDWPQGKAFSFEFTSQTWQGIPWTHRLQIYEPKDVKYPNMMLLFITGGSSRSGPPGEREASAYFPIAEACGARVVVLPQVPNQPLLGDKVEDALIAETFLRYLKTKDEEWPLLFPMVKSAVKAMDAAQAWSKERGQTVEKFVVTGASKRGWTTWLTGAVDDRVAAIAPMVIPTLNMRAQTKHQREVFGGKYSEEIADYSSTGLTEMFSKPEGERLWHLIDPYYYLDRIREPVIQINGTNDPYWTTDSVNLFWDDIRAPKHLIYVPNAVHGLDKSPLVGRYVVNGLGSIFRHVAEGKPLPKLAWTMDAEASQPRLEIESDPAPRSIRYWVAESRSQDFREATWKVGDEASGEAGHFRYVAERPASGYKAVFADLTYEFEGAEYHLSTQILIFGPEQPGK
jgi:PhoPQ-activated pathogenicity-related protein